MPQRKFGKWLLLASMLIALLIIASLLHLYINVMPEKQVEREFARIRAQGEAVTLAELAPPEIPDAENAALIYEQAFALYYEPSAEEESNLRDISDKDLSLWTEEDTAAIREYVEKNQESLHFIHQATDYQKCRFDIDYTSPSAVQFPHLSKMRNCARAAAREALLKAKEGEIDAALESLWAGLHIGQALLDEPFYISQLVRIGAYTTMLSAMEKILSENEASPEILKRLFEQLNIEEGRRAFARCLQSERSSQIDKFETVLENPGRLVQMMQGWSGTPTPSSASGTGYGLVLTMARPLLKRDEVFALNTMRRMIDLAQVPYFKAKAELDKLEQGLEEAPSYHILTRMFFPALTRGHLQQARIEARIGLAQLALGLKIYKAEKGNYPDTLAELVPEILPELPEDPFTGKDFVYKRQGEGFLVYSLGENTKDEGGKWDEENRYQHDIPWRSQR